VEKKLDLTACRFPVFRWIEAYRAAPIRKACRIIDNASVVIQLTYVEGSLTICSDGMKREHGMRLDGADAVAAPATVSGELAANRDHWETGKVRQTALTREPGDLPSAVPGLMGERGCSHIVGMFHEGHSASTDAFV
jgi:hypothetical protein